MLAFDRYLDPYSDLPNPYLKKEFIEDTLIEICKNIAQKGEKTRFSEIFDYLYEYIEDNLENFIEEVDYE